MASTITVGSGAEVVDPREFYRAFLQLGWDLSNVPGGEDTYVKVYYLYRRMSSLFLSGVMRLSAVLVVALNLPMVGKARRALDELLPLLCEIESAFVSSDVLYRYVLVTNPAFAERFVSGLIYPHGEWGGGTGGRMREIKNALQAVVVIYRHAVSSASYPADICTSSAAVSVRRVKGAVGPYVAAYGYAVSGELRSLCSVYTLPGENTLEDHFTLDNHMSRVMQRHSQYPDGYCYRGAFFGVSPPLGEWPSCGELRRNNYPGSCLSVLSPFARVRKTTSDRYHVLAWNENVNSDAMRSLPDGHMIGGGIDHSDSHSCVARMFEHKWSIAVPHQCRSVAHALKWLSVDQVCKVSSEGGYFCFVVPQGANKAVHVLWTSVADSDDMSALFPGCRFRFCEVSESSDPTHVAMTQDLMAWLECPDGVHCGDTCGSVSQGLGTCPDCDCVVRREGHTARCRELAVVPTSVKRSAWLGDVQQRLDVSAALYALDSNTPVGTLSAQRDEYVKAAAQAAWMIRTGRGTFREGETALSRRFEADYFRVRDEYLSETFPLVSLGPVQNPTVVGARTRATDVTFADLGYCYLNLFRRPPPALGAWPTKAEVAAHSGWDPERLCVEVGAGLWHVFTGLLPHGNVVPFREVPSEDRVGGLPTAKFAVDAVMEMFRSLRGVREPSRWFSVSAGNVLAEDSLKTNDVGVAYSLGPPMMVGTVCVQSGTFNLEEVVVETLVVPVPFAGALSWLVVPPVGDDIHWRVIASDGEKRYHAAQVGHGCEKSGKFFLVYVALGVPTDNQIVGAVHAVAWAMAGRIEAKL